jgi:hypothetical protein
MRFARSIFNIAGIYGLIVLTPHYFLENHFSTHHPPAITHPEYFYGFLGVAVAWQVLFLVIARDPVRYRLAMVPAMLEKFSFAIAVLCLWLIGRLDPVLMIPALIDLVFGILFIAAYLRTPREGGALLKT